jgi:hypothetical protein
MEAESSLLRWILAAVVAIAIILLVGFARHDAGVDGRAPDPGDVRVVVVPSP